MNKETEICKQWQLHAFSPWSRNDLKSFLYRWSEVCARSEGRAVGQALCLLGAGGPLSCFDVVLIRISDVNALFMCVCVCDLCSLTHFPTRTSQRGRVWKCSSTTSASSLSWLRVCVSRSWMLGSVFYKNSLNQVTLFVRHQRQQSSKRKLQHLRCS